MDLSKLQSQLQSFLAKAEETVQKAKILEESRPNLMGVFELFHIDHGRYPTREDFALQLVHKIQSTLNIPLKDKKCIDIGCRSGENLLAMQRQGAHIVGIDPDGSEFPNGMLCYKMTLQQFYAKFPDEQFDLATVFLWNIPFQEREEFTKILKKIIRSSGHAIIGYADAPYDKDPKLNVPDLMRRVFIKVERHECPDCLNQWLLVCSS